MPRDQELFKQDMMELMWGNAAIRDAVESSQKLRRWIKDNYGFCREDPKQWRNAAIEDQALQDYADKIVEAVKMCK